jgi:hypothetical protein
MSNSGADDNGAFVYPGSGGFIILNRVNDDLSFEQLKQIDPGDVLYVECEGTRGYQEIEGNSPPIMRSEIIYRVHVKDRF